MMRFASRGSREAEVAAGLTGRLVPERAEFLDEIVPAKVSGQPHTAMTSSLTKCSQMTFWRFLNGENPGSTATTTGIMGYSNGAIGSST